MKCVVRLHREQLNYFRRIARRAGEKETQAYLVGKVVSPELVVVDYFAHPKKYATQTTNEVAWYFDEWQALKKSVEESGKQIVGDIHSHPNWWPIPSPHDIKTTVQDGYRITGIYATMGKKSKVCFWLLESSLPARVDYAEEKD